MKDALEYIVTTLVDEPDKVEITEEDVDGILTLHVSVAKNDMGKIIGKDGKVIRGIRNVLKIKALKNNKRINVALVEIPQE